MFVYLYTNKMLLWFTVALLFIGMITVTIILYMFILSIVEKKRDKKREKEIENLKNTLSPYEFESTQLNAINKYFNFEEYIYSEDYVKVTKTFKDYYGFTHFVGEKWYFSCAYFLPYEDGYTLYISKNKIDISAIYLQNREETQKNICSHPEEYFEIIERGRFKRYISKFKNMIFVKGGKYKASFTDVKQEVFDIEVSKYLVTQDLWQEIMGNNPSYFKGNKKPVECISWWDCLEFCNKLSEKYNLKPVYDLSQKDKEIFKIIHLDGEIVEESKSNFKNTEGFRLPTELEWEWFASGGQKAIDEKTFNCKYSGSNKIDEVAWYAKNFCCEDEETKGTHIVGIKKANQLGLYDCTGNVWEWCFDIKSSIEKESRRLRGGSWYNANFDCTVLGRFFNEAKNLNYSIGFRIVRTI